jgi:hypothetical protein
MSPTDRGGLALSNAEMTAGRYARWAATRRLYRTIDEALAWGRIVTVSTYTRCTVYDGRHRDLFRADRRGVYVRAGKGEVAIGPDLTNVQVWPAGTKFGGSRRG